MGTGMSSERWRRAATAAVVVVYLALSTLYLLVIPTGESPDEPSHLQCIEQVSRYNRLPIMAPRPQGAVWWARERIISGLVCTHMPLSYLLAGYTQKLAHAITGAGLHYEFPPNNPRWETDESPAMFAHPPKASPLAYNEPATLAVLRLEAIALGLVSVLAAGYVARRLVPHSPHAPVLAMMLVAGWPQFLFMSRAITNDSLAVALAAGTLMVLVNTGQPRRYILAGALAALAVLAKLTMTFAIAAVILAWVLEFGWTRDKAMRQRLMLNGAIAAGVLGLLAALVWLQPTLRDNLEWAQRNLRANHPQALTPAYWLDVGLLTLRSGWGRFGWMNVLTPDAQAATWWAALLLSSILGGAVQWRRGAPAKARLVLWIVCAWLACVAASYLRIQVNRFQPQFRYALAMVPVLAAFSGAGWAVLPGASERLARALEVLLLGALAAINLWLIFAVLVPAYG